MRLGVGMIGSPTYRGANVSVSLAGGEQAASTTPQFHIEQRLRNRIAHTLGGRGSEPTSGEGQNGWDPLLSFGVEV